MLLVAFLGILALQGCDTILGARPSGSPPVAGHPTAKPKPGFPDSTMLCGIKFGDKIPAIIRRLGRGYKKANMAIAGGDLTRGGGDDSVEVIIYNDPKYDAHIIISSGGSLSPLRDATVVGIKLIKGRVPGHHLASESFAAAGDYYGLTLNANLNSIRQFYPTIRLSGGGGKLTCESGVPSPSGEDCYIAFHLHNNKVDNIFAGYSP
jgi:hypothetical protein